MQKISDIFGLIICPPYVLCLSHTTTKHAWNFVLDMKNLSLTQDSIVCAIETSFQTLILIVQALICVKWAFTRQIPVKLLAFFRSETTFRLF